MKILFVCLGNICRSPIAQGIFEDLIANNAEAQSTITMVDSAGTADYHIGKLPDSRMRETAIQHGFNIDHLRGRQVADEDFQNFDRIFAMDTRNYENLLARCPDNLQHKISLFLSGYADSGLTDVPDPFHGDAQDFQDVLKLIQAGASRILDSVVPVIHS